MVKSAMHAAHIIDSIRSLYRRGAPKLKRIDLNEIIREIAALLRDTAKRNAISIRTELDTGLPTATADRVQLQQVVMNLMLNGIEAMKETGGELTVTSSTERGWSVADFGERSGHRASRRPNRAHIRCVLHHEGARHRDGTVDQSKDHRSHMAAVCGRPPMPTVGARPFSSHCPARSRWPGRRRSEALTRESPLSASRRKNTSARRRRNLRSGLADEIGEPMHILDEPRATSQMSIDSVAGALRTTPSYSCTVVQLGRIMV